MHAKNATLLDKLSKRELLLDRIDQRLSDLKASGGNADLEAFLRALVEVAPSTASSDSYQTAEIFHPKFQIEASDTKAKLNVVGVVL